jgi:predicted neutral ceramidase superfamily lipid hydrolase
MQQPDGRDETPTERLDRNWDELLQELRVTQTGVQLLTAFLLSLPLQQRFSELEDYQRSLYLVAVGLSVLATGLLVTPVAVHRRLFRHHEKDRLVAVSDLAARAGLGLLALAISTVVTFIFGVVVGVVAAGVAGIVALLVMTVLWWLVPHVVRERGLS